MNWWKEAFGDFGEIEWYTLAIVIAAVATGIAGLVWYRKKRAAEGGTVTHSQWTTHELTMAALCIGLAFLLSFIKIFSMPMGGSITPASMLPLLAFSYIYGVKKGLLAGLVYGILQFIQSPVVLAPMQVLLDYPLAFGALGLAGLAKNSVVPGIIYGCAGRFVCSWLSGWVFFAEYAPEGMPGWLYSLGVNGGVIGADCAVCIAVAAIPALYRMFNHQKALAQRQEEERLTKLAAQRTV